MFSIHYIIWTHSLPNKETNINKPFWTLKINLHSMTKHMGPFRTDTNTGVRLWLAILRAPDTQILQNSLREQFILIDSLSIVLLSHLLHRNIKLPLCHLLPQVFIKRYVATNCQNIHAVKCVAEKKLKCYTQYTQAHCVKSCLQSSHTQ